VSSEKLRFFRAFGPDFRFLFVSVHPFFFSAFGFRLSAYDPQTSVRSSSGVRPPKIPAPLQKSRKAEKDRKWDKRSALLRRK
jgi:hypothetical protein